MINSNTLSAIAYDHKPLKIQAIDTNTSANHSFKEYDLSFFSFTSKSEDMIWIIDKYEEKINHPSTMRKLDFRQINYNAELVKNYIYYLLITSHSLEDIQKKIRSIKHFINFCNKDVDKINNIDIERYSIYQTKRNVTPKTKHSDWAIITSYLEHFNLEISNTMKLYDFPYIASSGLPDQEKYISDFVVNQFDYHMRYSEVPLHYRLYYWLLRLYPNRGTETASFKMDCLKHYHDNIYSIISKIYKTAGDKAGSTRILLLDIDEPTQNYLYNLIIEQQKIASNIRNDYPNLPDFLFVCHRSRYFKRLNRYVYDRKPSIMKLHDFNDFMKRFAIRNGIKDENGETAHVSSHMFRHNATSDRVDTKIFRPIDLRPMTMHANEQMFNKNYHSVTREDFSDKMHNVDSIRTGKEVLFKGKIINSDNPNTFDYFLNNIFAFRIGNLGICSDCRDCSNDKFKCLKCDYFIPNADDLEYYIEQLEDWEKKLVIAKKMQRPQLIENIESNIELFTAVIDRIKKGIEKWNEAPE